MIWSDNLAISGPSSTLFAFIFAPIVSPLTSTLAPLKACGAQEVDYFGAAVTLEQMKCVNMDNPKKTPWPLTTTHISGAKAKAEIYATT